MSPSGPKGPLVRLGRCDHKYVTFEMDGASPALFHL